MYDNVHNAHNNYYACVTISVDSCCASLEKYNNTKHYHGSKKKKGSEKGSGKKGKAPRTPLNFALAFSYKARQNLSLVFDTRERVLFLLGRTRLDAVPLSPAPLRYARAIAFGTAWKSKQLLFHRRGRGSDANTWSNQEPERDGAQIWCPMHLFSGGGIFQQKNIRGSENLEHSVCGRRKVCCFCKERDELYYL